MCESMVSAEHYKALQAENDQLKARVAELEEGIKSYIPLAVPDVIVQELLNRSPAQSLSLLKAEVLEEYSELVALNLPEDYERARDYILGQAAQLRKEAGT